MTLGHIKVHKRQSRFVSGSVQYFADTGQSLLAIETILGQFSRSPEIVTLYTVRSKDV